MDYLLLSGGKLQAFQLSNDRNVKWSRSPIHSHSLKTIIRIVPKKGKKKKRRLEHVEVTEDTPYITPKDIPDVETIYRLTG